MRTYELVLVIRPSVKEADRKKLFEQIKEWLGKDVKVAKADDWGQRRSHIRLRKKKQVIIRCGNLREKDIHRTLNND